MKKIILLFSALMLTTAAFAQRGWDWGVKGGLNISTLTKLDDANAKASIYVGAFAEFQINDWFSVSPELIYSRQGFKANSTIGGIEVDGWNRLNYLNIPILAKFYIFDRLSVDVGPQFGILLNARGKVKENGNTHKSDLDGYKGFDVSFPVGLTWRALQRLDVSARYNIGLTDVHDDNNWKNGVFQLGVGWRF